MVQTSIQLTLKELLAALLNPDYKIRKWAVREIASRYPAQAVQPLLPLLKDSRCELRKLVARTLGTLHDRQAVEPLCDALGDKHPKVREQVILALANLADGRAVKPLLALLADPDWAIRHYAIYALGSLRDPAAIAPLIAQLATTTTHELGTIIQALGHMEDPRAIDPVIDVLRRDGIYPPIIGYIEVALERFRSPRVSHGLQALLSDPATSVLTRANAAHLLGRLRCFAAVPQLIDALTDKDASVRFRAVVTLRVLGNPCAIEPLKILLNDEDEHIRAEVVQSLSDLQQAGRTFSFLYR